MVRKSMEGSNHRKLIALSLAIVLALGLVTYALWRSAQSEEDTVSPQDPPLSMNEAVDSETGQAEAAPAEPQTTLLSARTAGDLKAAQNRKVPTTQVTIPHDVAMDDYKTRLWADIRANPPAFSWPGDPELDADMAYRLYMYYGNCSVLLSRGDQMDEQIDKIESRAARADGRSLQKLEGRLDRMIDFFDLCLPIPPEVDARMEAVVWMSEAVRLGHEIAEVQFYEKAMGFMLRTDPSANRPPLAMQHPQLVADFKTTARLGLARALEKGHPEAYLAKSRAVLEGLIYKKDPVLAYAYVRLAEQEASKNRVILSELDDWKQQTAKYLNPEQIAEAEQLLQELKAP